LATNFSLKISGKAPPSYIFRAAFVFVAASSGACASEPDRFHQNHDAERVAECFATYFVLAEASLGMLPKAAEDKYQVESIEGTKNLEPYVRSSVSAIGQDFYRRAAISKFSMRRRLERLEPNSPSRLRIIHTLEKEAETCDQLVEQWNTHQR
jgi:hypothetical protein